MTEQLRRIDSIKEKSTEMPTNFEEAIALTGSGRFHYVLLMVSGLCMMGVMIEIFSTSFLLPSAQCDFKFSSEEKGLLNSICMIGMAWLVIPQTWSFELPWCTFNSWRIFVLLCAVPGLLAAIFLALWFPESPKFLMVVDKKEEALEVLRDMYARNTGNSPQRFPVKSLVLLEDGSSNPLKNVKPTLLGILQHMWRQTVPLLMPPFVLKTLLVCIIQFGLYASANGLSLWLPDIFNHLAAYSTLHPGSSGSICQAYAITTNNSISENSHNNLSTTLSINDTIYFTCDIDQVILKVNNEITPFSNETDIFQCQNGSLLRPKNSDMLLFDIEGGNVTVSVLNETMKRLFSTETSSCNPDVDLSVFQNTFILGIVNAASLYIVGHLIGPFSKKTILVTNLTLGGIAGFVLNYVYTMWEVLLVGGILVTLSGMCISLLVSTVVEMFPTHLRAMAVCLSLMIGRFGSVCINMLMGILLEANCTLMIFLMGGICTTCGLLCILLPSPKKI
ncbi:synaptic vesicle glycoprotein 2B isoform X2 [Anabrus simplex]|uniref:synaptic vesicle glycoprotein 2B isoform X2 n=1 Tax=Anabrus simplex TaxID=316456 RepID=UPI0035A2E519